MHIGQRFNVPAERSIPIRVLHRFYDKMTGCCTFGCTKRTEKGFKMYRFPSDAKRRKIWENRVSRVRLGFLPSYPIRVKMTMQLSLRHIGRMFVAHSWISIKMTQNNSPSFNYNFINIVSTCGTKLGFILSIFFQM